MEQHLRVERLSAVVFRSPEPARLAGFYRENLGIAFEAESHGPMREHWEVMLGDMHLAILKGVAGRGVAPTFRVKNMGAWVALLEQRGVERLHPVADLGEGKKLATYRDPDGNNFSLIDLAQHLADQGVRE